MIHRRPLPETDAIAAIEAGEFPESIRRSNSHVAIVLTQDWCPQWAMMRRYLTKLEEAGGPEDLEVDVYELEYNRVPYGNEFMEFKERVLGNDLIPYVRYYRDGELIGESNYLGKRGFLDRLTAD